MKFNTKTIHGGQSDIDPAYNSVMPAIYQTSTYRQSSPGENKGFAYSRSGNPTRQALERLLASLENGAHGLAFGSGVAAIDAILRLMEPGDEIICTQNLYGGTHRLFTQIFQNSGVKFHFVDMSDPELIHPLINDRTKMIWIETPTNPLMNIIDIKAVAQIAQSSDILLGVDNTFATPYLQRPLDLGADIVMNSATKYLGGHSDVILGALVVKDDAMADKLYFTQKTCGAVPGPQDCFLVIRGIKTLHLRMQRHCENGKKVADYLRSHDKVDKVYYPGFKSHPSHDIARSQMLDFGGMMSFTLRNAELKETKNVLERFQVFTLAESLGGVESLVGHPATMTHASVPRATREEMGIVDSLIRLSVGIEDLEDLILDLENAIG